MQISHEDMAVHALVWPHVVWLGASCANLRQPYIFKHQIYGKELVMLLSKYGILYMHAGGLYVH